jgi:Ran GTPase-activating protein (RanGAP) involved in mRNA processing and transport
MGMEGARIFSDVLTIKTLHKLDLFGNDLGDAGDTVLASALMVNKVLKVLDISGCSIGGAGAAKKVLRK